MVDPLWINASGGLPEYDANEVRQGMALAMMYDGRAVGARQGVRPGGTQFEVSIDGSGNITVAPGVALVDPGLSTPQGPYWVGMGAADTSLAIDPADATNPRKDIVVLRVYDDDEDSSGLRTARPEYLAGTPAPSPTEPAVPAGALRLATIDVPQSGGGSPVVTDRRPYTVAAGGLLPVPNQAARDAVTDYPGLAVYRLDQGWTEIHDGSGWRVQGVPTVSAVGDLSTLITDPYHGQLAYVTGEDRIYRYTGSAWVSNIEGPWTDFTPTVYTNMGTTPAAISSGSIQVNYAKYRKVGRTVDAMASVVINTTTTNGVGIDLPFASSTRLFNCGTCLLMGPGTLPSDQSGVAYMFTDNARLVLVAYTNGFRDVQTSGQQLRYSVRYEAAS